MENTRSKITVNLYGNKNKAFLAGSDPTLDELVDAFVVLLESHDFNVEDIHEAFVNHLISTIKESDYKAPDITDELFFDLATRKKTNK
jgi:hypothetical protein